MSIFVDSNAYRVWSPPAKHHSRLLSGYILNQSGSAIAINNSLVNAIPNINGSIDDHAKTRIFTGNSRGKFSRITGTSGDRSWFDCGNGNPIKKNLQRWSIVVGVSLAPGDLALSNSDGGDPRVFTKDAGFQEDEHTVMVGFTRLGYVRVRIGFGGSRASSTLFASTSVPVNEDNKLNILAATYDGATLTATLITSNGTFVSNTESKSGDLTTNNDGCAIGRSVGGANNYLFGSPHFVFFNDGYNYNQTELIQLFFAPYRYVSTPDILISYSVGGSAISASAQIHSESLQRFTDSQLHAIESQQSFFINQQHQSESLVRVASGFVHSTESRELIRQPMPLLCESLSNIDKPMIVLSESIGVVSRTVSVAIESMFRFVTPVDFQAESLQSVSENKMVPSESLASVTLAETHNIESLGLNGVSSASPVSIESLGNINVSRSHPIAVLRGFAVNALGNIECVSTLVTSAPLAIESLQPVNGQYQITIEALRKMQQIANVPIESLGTTLALAISYEELEMILTNNFDIEMILTKYHDISS